MARFNASKLRSAINRYNSAVRKHNTDLRRAVADYNRGVQRFNTQVRELHRQLARLQQRSHVRAYTEIRAEIQVVASYQEHALLVHEHEWLQMTQGERISLQTESRENDLGVIVVDTEGNEV